MAIRCDNELELTNQHFLAWCVERQIELAHIHPGNPTQNAQVDSFHGRLREECLNVSRTFRLLLQKQEHARQNDWTRFEAELAIPKPATSGPRPQKRSAAISMTTRSWRKNWQN